MKYAPIRVVTDAIEGVAKTYYGKRLTIPAYTENGIKHPSKVTDLVEVVVGSMAYHLTPTSLWATLSSANDHGGWQVVGTPRRTRRSLAASRKTKDRMMAKWERDAVDSAVMAVLEEDRRGRGETPSMLADNLFNNWGIGMGSPPRFIRDATPEGVFASGTSYKLGSDTRARVSAVTASLERLKKRGVVVSFWGSGLHKSEARNYVLAKYDKG